MTGKVENLGKPTLVHLAKRGIDYDLKLVDRPLDGPTQGLFDTHPQGQSPQLILASGQVITQASAIVLYLLRTYDTEHRFHDPAPTTEDMIREEYLLSLANADLISHLRCKTTFAAVNIRSPFFIRPLTGAINRQVFAVYLDPKVANIVKVLDTELAGRQWLMGGEEPSRPDFAMKFAVELGAGSGYIDLETLPSVKAWSERCSGRDAWKWALEKGNGFDLNWPDRLRR